METLLVKIALCRLSQKIAFTKINGIYSVNDRSRYFEIIQDELSEYNFNLKVSVLEYVLTRTTTEIIDGVINNNPEAIIFNEYQLIIPQNI